MTVLPSLAMQTYVGVLTLDDNTNRAMLTVHDINGHAFQMLLMIDTAPDGNFSQQRVVDAWRYFSLKPGIHNQSTISVTGFWHYPPDSGVPVLHVVRA